eukprot:759732-Hanusia_phi.AAC.2
MRYVVTALDEGRRLNRRVPVCQSFVSARQQGPISTGNFAQHGRPRRARPRQALRSAGVCLFLKVTVRLSHSSGRTVTQAVSLLRGPPARRPPGGPSQSSGRCQVLAYHRDDHVIIRRLNHRA